MSMKASDLGMLGNEKEVIICDKCDSAWTDKECPRPATWAKVHYGQFGHKCLHLYCNECRDLRYADAPENATEEEKLLREIFKEKPEDIVWEPYEESNA